MTEEWETLSFPLPRHPQVPSVAAAPLSKEEARAKIAQYALGWDIKVGATTAAIPSVNGTAAYYALEPGGKSAVYYHADGARRGEIFRLRKGIGWYYQAELRGTASRLGLPISDEESTTSGAVHHFEAGYIEWDSQASLARAYLGKHPDRSLLLYEKLL